jgi:hypothetical protein
MLGRFLLAALTLAVVALDGRAADLSAIKRVIAKEPAYQGRPRYALLVFGPDAKSRIWMVRDDRNLYVDRSGTGDLTAAGAKVNGDPNGYMNIPDIGAPGSQKNLTLQNVGDQFRLTYSAKGDERQFVGIGLMERPTWGDKAENAPIIHFDGPMTLAQYGPPVNLPRGDNNRRRANSLRLMVGTPGLGKGTFASYDEVCSQNLGNIHAEITYTKADDKSKTFTDRCELIHDG